MTALRCTTFWAMAFCVLGALGPFFPFQAALLNGSVVIPGDLAGGFSKHALGVCEWQGVVIAVTMLLTLLFLIAVSPLTPPPLWRSAILGVVGFVALLLICLYYAQLPHVYAWPSLPWYVHLGGLMIAAAAWGLLVVASLDVRTFLLRRREIVPPPPFPETPPLTEPPHVEFPRIRSEKIQ